jgi:glycosyltransferase involved in cell wall biosynthesis
MVLPLRFGGGVRIRMLEAAAMGTPVVSTPDGVKGLNLKEGREYLEAATAEEFAGAVVRLLQDEALAREIGKNARLWAERNISSATYPDRLNQVLNRMIENRWTE